MGAKMVALCIVALLAGAAAAAWQQECGLCDTPALIQHPFGPEAWLSHSAGDGNGGGHGGGTSVTKLTDADRARGPATRKAIHAGITLITNPLPLPEMLRDQIAESVTTDMMEKRKHLEPKQRLLMDNVLQMELPGPNASFHAVSSKVADMLNQSGYNHEADSVLAVESTLKTVYFMTHTFKPLKEQVDSTRHGPLNFAELSKVVHELAQVKDNFRMREPIPEVVGKVVDTIRKNQKALLDLAALFEAKSKDTRGWTPASQLLGELKMTSVSPLVAFIAEYAFWAAEAKRKGASPVQLFHESLLMVQDLQALKVISLQKPEKDFLRAATQLCETKTEDMRQLLPIFGRYLGDASAPIQPVREALGQVSQLFEQRMASSKLKDVFNAAILLYPTAVLLGGLDAPDESTKAAMVPAVTDVLLLAYGLLQPTDSPTVLREMSFILGNTRALRMGNHSVHFGGEAAAISTFLGQMAGLVETNSTNARNVLPFAAQLLDGLKVMTPDQRVLLADQIKSALLFLCNLDGVRATRPACARIPKAGLVA
mmetsp:Transcript_53406/g.165286  ORF Transcript_53406/g.165286 Transcript_53406/m.165286 type:complete len:541 (+) Transcript_53406:66-1688(+)